jgi:hypothetical protein
MNNLQILLTRLQIVESRLGRDGQAELSWTAQPGRTYRVQYADDLNRLVWRDLPGEVYALGGAASSSDPGAALLGQRYYRVLLVE